MPYATLRFVQLGWRVIRVEPTARPGAKTKGDPNRSVGRPFAGADRHSYFVAPNVGKEAIALDLKSPSGRAQLSRILRELDVDVFCTNTMPARHESLGIDYATLSKGKPDLIWAGISALGLKYPEVPGYDPMMQALCGYMDLTGDKDGPPLQCGPPITDLKAGDEVFAQVLLALYERTQTGKGKCVDVAMGNGAVSWLLTFLPMLDMGSAPGEIKRNGNEHRQFIPTNSYPTSDGYLFMAIGSDVQWSRLVQAPAFRALDDERYRTNEGRRADRDNLHRRIGALTSKMTMAAASEALAAAEIPHAPITPIEGVFELPFVKERVLTTTAPDGRVVRMPPAAVDTAFLNEQGRALPFAPRYGEHTESVLREVGVSDQELTALRKDEVIA
ncbi:MAG: CoA transferase [Deltaproteobacteria bacterium]|nr:CoA transferase [Deltaproteobacteria bacterium]